MSNLENELNNLKETGEAPNWMTLAGYTTISRGYRLKGETPRKMYERVSKSAAKYLKDRNFHMSYHHLAGMFFQAMWNNWLCPASPVLSNLGLDRGLPISCYGNDVGDSIQSIMGCATELALLTKGGGGVGINLQRVRPRGSLIKNGENGLSEGIIPFMKIYDSTVIGISQGSTRRGAASANLNIEHGDWHEFVRMRRPEGDVNRQCQNLHHCTVIDNNFMEKVLDGDYKARAKWAELMKSRMETGEPYIMYKDNVNNNNPEAYKKNDLKIDMTNICSEITLYTDDDHSFICCLASLNLSRWDEWRNTNIRGYSIPAVATLFLNAVLDEFIDKGSQISGLEKVVRHAKKGRAIGIGVLGWHTLLQSKNMAFEGFQTMMLNAEIFKYINKEAVKQSKSMAYEFGETEWCDGTGMFK